MISLPGPHREKIFSANPGWNSFTETLMALDRDTSKTVRLIAGWAPNNKRACRDRVRHRKVISCREKGRISWMALHLPVITYCSELSLFTVSWGSNETLQLISLNWCEAYKDGLNIQAWYKTTKCHWIPTEKYINKNCCEGGCWWPSILWIKWISFSFM